MKKLLLLLFLILASFSTFADGHHLRDFSLSDFCYEQPNVQNRGGVYYFPNKSVGITDTSICVYKDAFGQYSSKGNIVRGVFDGLWTGWTRNGEMWLETYYINGKVVPIVCRDDLLDFDKDETYFDLYDEPLTGYNRCTDGEKARITGEIINGKREGAWSILIHSNKEFIEANYLNGKYNGVVEKGYHIAADDSMSGWYEISTSTNQNYKDGKCISSNIYNAAGDAVRPCSGEDEQEPSSIVNEEDQLNTLTEAEVRAEEAEQMALEAFKQKELAEEATRIAIQRTEEEQQKLNQLQAERAAAQEAFEKEQYDRLLTQEVQAEQDLSRMLIIEDQMNTLKSAYVNNIAARVKSYWRYQGAKDGWGCTVYVRQDIDGRVEAVNIQKCNLDNSEEARRFKNSIERAVYKASPFLPAPDEAVFDEEIIFYFRAL